MNPRINVSKLLEEMQALLEQVDTLEKENAALNANLFENQERYRKQHAIDVELIRKAKRSWF